jgi:hypothetical protein
MLDIKSLTAKKKYLTIVVKFAITHCIVLANHNINPKNKGTKKAISPPFLKEV